MRETIKDWLKAILPWYDEKGEKEREVRSTSIIEQAKTVERTARSELMIKSYKKYDREIRTWWYQ